MVEVANVASRMRNTRLRQFYLSIKARRGHKIAIVALARKMLCILHHLLTNEERYKEGGVAKEPRLKNDERNIPLEDMITIRKKAGYIVTERHSFSSLI